MSGAMEISSVKKSIVEDFAQQEDLVAGWRKIYVNKWSVDILE